MLLSYTNLLMIEIVFCFLTWFLIWSGNKHIFKINGKVVKKVLLLMLVFYVSTIIIGFLIDLFTSFGYYLMYYLGWLMFILKLISPDVELGVYGFFMEFLCWVVLPNVQLFLSFYGMLLQNKKVVIISFILFFIYPLIFMYGGM